MTAHHKIAVIGGDGIGPEVVAEGLKVLEVVARRFGVSYETVSYPFGTDLWLATGGRTAARPSRSRPSTR